MVNLPALGNEDRADELRGRVATLLAEVGDHAESTRAFVELGELREPEPGPDDGSVTNLGAGMPAGLASGSA